MGFWIFGRNKKSDPAKAEASAQLLASAIALARLAQGNTSNLKAVGGGVTELRVHFGPGYRVYLSADGRDRWILQCGR